MSFTSTCTVDKLESDVCDEYYSSILHTSLLPDFNAALSDLHSNLILSSLTETGMGVLIW